MTHSSRQDSNYWVIWMPTYIHSDFDEIIKPRIEKNISDDPNRPQKIIVELQVNNDINLTYLDRLSQAEYIIQLKYIEKSSDGLFLYECICLTNDVVTHALSKNPHHASIHAVKELYHKHLFHGEKNKYEEKHDYYYGVYIHTPINNKAPEINANNSDVLKYYLEKIEKKYYRCFKIFEEQLHSDDNQEQISLISEYYKSIEQDEKIDLKEKEEIKKILDKINKSQNIEKNKRNIEKNKRKKLGKIYRESNHIVGQTLFTNTLCSSKYLNPSRDDNIRKFLQNNENLKTGLYYIRDYHKFTFDYNNVKNAKKIGIASIILAVILAIFNFIYTDKKSYQNEVQIKKYQEELIQKQDSLITNFIYNMLQ